MFSQEVEISGKITDINSREPLAFVNIIITGTSTGGTTDINGEFKIKSSTPVSSLSLSYVGYKPLIFQVGTKFSKINIGMEREVYTLKEVEIIAKENPAIPIIKKAAKNRNINNFNEIVKYSGIVFNDLVADKNTIYSPNSDSIVDLDKFLHSVEVFMVQNTEERSYYYGRDTVSCTNNRRYAGFQNPEFLQRTDEFRNFNLYDDKITIGAGNYISPLSRRGINRYYYILGDTLINEKDTVYVILFRQIMKSRFEKEGLSGLLYISTNRYRLKNAVTNHTEEYSNHRIKIHQKYEIFREGTGENKRITIKRATHVMMWVL
ncbi:MAG: hypothetical protein A3G23_06175 [Bacteroidetes bacterium RIFCSPLOWO2_12_FULL_37_12]|nr:MAG: hypothetical protein A3G23_06175 [Bacteroidetes bacterium RIFCSPLOWO2_12_FULL_37_12]